MDQFHEFGGDDGGDQRGEIWRLLDRIGKVHHPAVADELRAAFLRSLVPSSDACFAHLPCLVTPCTTGQAYRLFVQITGVLGVDIRKAARRLEEFVKKNEWGLKGLVAG